MADLVNGGVMAVVAAFVVLLLVVAVQEGEMPIGADLTVDTPMDGFPGSMPEDGDRARERPDDGGRSGDEGPSKNGERGDGRDGANAGDKRGDGHEGADDGDKDKGDDDDHDDDDEADDGDDDDD